MYFLVLLVQVYIYLRWAGDWARIYLLGVFIFAGRICYYGLKTIGILYLSGFAHYRLLSIFRAILFIYLRLFIEETQPHLYGLKTTGLIYLCVKTRIIYLVG